jgi:short chain dehydrogenase
VVAAVKPDRPAVDRSGRRSLWLSPLAVSFIEHLISPRAIITPWPCCQLCVSRCLTTVMRSTRDSTPGGAGRTDAFMRRFDGRVAVVTGAAHGIGRATAARLTAEGAAVGIADIDTDAAEETVRTLTNAGTDAVRPDV